MRIIPQKRDAGAEIWDKNSADEHQWWPRTMWIDPGGVTGVCILWFHPQTFLDKTQPTIRSVIAWQAMFVRGGENEQVHTITNLIREIGGPSGLTVGIETFTIRQLNTSHEFLSPVRLRAALDFQLWRGLKEYDDEIRRRPLLTQSPADAKTAIGDDKLRRMMLWTPGADHARDATRHAVLHLRRLRNLGGDTFRRLYGWEEGWSE